ncbi:hypothetical protein [Flavobacterium sp. 3HN19-14]|uniref:hypothetical protein n=1 Tax=Flavobacterium sp. 3HN19-14 TaxID=3448133 RepID=UPI003EE3BC8A
MRAIYFFISLFFLLLGNGADAYAGVQHHGFHKTVKHVVGKNQHGKLIDKNQDNNIIEDTDVDLEEEFGADSVKDNSGSKFFIEKFSATQAQSGINSCYTSFTKFKNFPAVIGYSSPIYIVHRVLRI